MYIITWDGEIVLETREGDYSQSQSFSEFIIFFVRPARVTVAVAIRLDVNIAVFLLHCIGKSPPHFLDFSKIFR